MKRIPLFLCVLIISLMVMSDVNAAMDFHSQEPNATVAINKTKLNYGTSRTNIPISTNDQDIPEIKTAPLFSSLPPTLCIHTDQEIVFLFEIFFQVTQFENYYPTIPVTFSSLFLHLFRIVVSPNAP